MALNNFLFVLSRHSYCANSLLLNKNRGIFMFNRFTFYIAAVLIFLCSFTFSQTPINSWNIGFGGTYPRMMSLWSQAYSGTRNYGAFFSIQRNFSEHVGLRFLTTYNHMTTVYDFPTQSPNQSVDLIAGNLDLLYYFVPCEPVSPYVAMGAGLIFFRSKNSFQTFLDDDNWIEFLYNMRFGSEWRLNDSWKIVTEVAYHQPSTNKLDGEYSSHEHKGIFGSNSDSYWTFNFGFLYFFSQGEPSKLCDLYSGLRVEVPPCNCPTLEQIDSLIKANMPKQEPMVGIPMPEEERWILVGVNFEFNKATLTDGSYPILLNAIKVLNQNPDIQIEVQGYADWIGSEAYNQKLSERRAETVRNYLVANGIDSGRITTKGYGETMPIADNKTEEGRALNRRIEFKIIEQ